jgi:hypothetical protein
MAFLIIVSMLLGWAFAILGLGVFIHGLINGPQSDGAHSDRQEIEFTICGFLGLAGYSLLAACLNFAVPIDNYVSFCLMFLGWGLIVAKRRAAFLWLKNPHIAVAAMVFGYVCVIPLTPVINYDTGLYHWQTIKWIIQEPLVPGLANLHERFGFNSLWLTFAALVDLPPKLYASPNFISNSLAMFFYGVGIFLSLKMCFKGDTNLSNLFMASTAIPWLSKVAYFMNSPSPDLPVMLITFLIIYLLILSLERPASRLVGLSLATILSAFAVSVKLVAVPLLPIVGGWCLVEFCSARLKRQGVTAAAIKSNVSATRNPTFIALCMASSMVIVWLTRGVFLSGCPAYPSTLGCMQGLKWAVSIESTKELAAVIQRWARLPGSRNSEALSNWNWFHEWMSRNMYLEAGLVALFLIGTCLLIVAVVRNGSCAVTKKAFLIPALIAFLGVAFWFVSAPDPRFAYGFLFSLGLLVFSQGVLSLQPSQMTTTKGVSYGVPKVFAAAMTGVLLVTFFCQSDTWTGMGSGLAQGVIFVIMSVMSLRPNQIWFWTFCVAILLSGNVPQQTLRVRDWFVWGSFPAVAVKEEVTHQGFIVRYPLDAGQCWNTEVPCAPRVVEDLRAAIPEPGRYRMFWIQKD